MTTDTLVPPRVRTTLDRVVGWLSEHSITALRVSLGLVFLGFGVLKFIPGASPAEELAVRTLESLSLGIVSGTTALWVTATAETFIGLTLVSGRLIRAGLAVLGVSMVGIMSPLVLFFDELFAGGPTLVAQYVLKDIVLITAALVIASKSTINPPPHGHRPDGVALRKSA
jgi:putative oxidoreductase